MAKMRKNIFQIINEPEEETLETNTNKKLEQLKKSM